MRTRAKICGITRSQDIQAVVNAGADAIGFVFFQPSPRHVSAAQAKELIQNVRSIDSPAGTLVGGVAADYTDSQNGISRTLPWALGWIVLSVLVLIFVFTGSIILPI